MSFYQTEWPAARIENLRAFYADGDTATIIAEKLSKIEGIKITRNMVCGKIDRLGLTTRPKVKKTEAELKAARERRREQWKQANRKRLSSVTYLNTHKRSSRAERMTMLDHQELPPLNLTLADLTMKDGRPVECRYITNSDMANATYCGLRAVGESSYCNHHRMLCTRPGNYAGPKHLPRIACAA